MTDLILATAIAVLVVALVCLGVWALRLKRREQETIAQLGAEKVGLETRLDETATRVNILESETEGLRGRLEAENQMRVAAETRLEAEQRNLREQRALLDEAERKLKDAFAALSAEALTKSRQEFLGQAEEKLRPIQDLLRDYQQKLDAIEKARNTAYGGLQQHLNGLRDAQQVLQKEAQQLAMALRNPAVRGRWGESQLHRVLELAGMSDFCDFHEQETQPTEGGSQRPDVTINLPSGRRIPIDSKAPLDAYLDAYEASDETAREAALERHAQAIQKQVRSLSTKAYWESLEEATDFVVLFLPGESFFAAALKSKPTLFEEAIQKGVVIATPMTLYALLRAVAVGWQEKRLAENAERIAEVGQKVYECLRVFAEHFRRVGDGLRKAATAYNDAIGSYEQNLGSSARRLAELGASSGKEIPELPTVDGPTRMLGPADDPKGAE